MNRNIVHNCEMRNSLILPSLLIYIVSQFDFILGYILAFTVIILMIIKSNKIVLTSAIWPLIFIFIIGVLQSLLNLEISAANFLRDLLYFSRPILLIYLGYMIGIKLGENSFPLIIKIFIEYAAFGVLTSFLMVIFQLQKLIGNPTFLQLRALMQGTDESTMIGFAVLIFYPSYLGNKVKIFSAKVSMGLKLLFFISLVISLSRMQLIIFFITFLVLYLFSNKSYIKKSTLFSVPLVILSAIISINLLSKIGLLTTFLLKVTNSLNEISSKSDWSNYYNIVNDWRGYESYTARLLFSQFTFVNKIIGSGFGTLIPVNYSNLVGVPLSNGGIIQLHNGYYSMLVKVGFSGIILYLIFLIRIFFWSNFYNSNSRLSSALLKAISLVIVTCSFVTTGIFKSVFPFGLLIFIGYLLQHSKIYQKSNNHYN